MTTAVARGVTPTVAHPPYTAPSLWPRLGGGVGLFVLWFALWGAVPYLAASWLAGHGISVGLPVTWLLLVGGLIALLGAAAYLLRPTRAYGPTLIIGASVSLGYVLLLLPTASVGVGLPDGGTVSLGYGAVLVVLAVVVAVRLTAAVLVTVQDARYPYQRRAYEFPANDSAA